MADFREISQEYAKGALNSAILINGGAAVALLSQVADLDQTNRIAGVRSAMICWAIGTAAGALGWLFGFLSTRYVDKSEVENSRHFLVVSDRWMVTGMLSLAFAIASFLAGCLTLALSF